MVISLVFFLRSQALFRVASEGSRAVKSHLLCQVGPLVQFVSMDSFELCCLELEDLAEVWRLSEHC